MGIIKKLKNAFMNKKEEEEKKEEAEEQRSGDVCYLCGTYGTKDSPLIKWMGEKWHKKCRRKEIKKVKRFIK